jgi:ADP-ribosyl-[dinitrogen reductase] hydrolase
VLTTIAAEREWLGRFVAVMGLQPASVRDAARDPTTTVLTLERSDDHGTEACSRMKRTSMTHPLQIAVVSAAPGFGRIGITFCPGKHDPNAISGYWDRDLACDLDAIRDWGATAVVTLIEPAELILLRVERLGEEVARRNMRWFHLPITDVSVPDSKFEENWLDAGHELRSLLRSGRDVLVHCRGGLGRAGTIAARLLVELGVEPDKATADMRAARPGAIETREQERFVRGIVACRDDLGT